MTRLARKTFPLHTFAPVNRVEYCNTEAVDPETHEPHEEYLAAFKRTMIEKLRGCIDNSLATDPDGGKGKRKTVQVMYEVQCQLDSI